MCDDVCRMLAGADDTQGERGTKELLGILNCCCGGLDGENRKVGEFKDMGGGGEL